MRLVSISKFDASCRFAQVSVGSMTLQNFTRFEKCIRKYQQRWDLKEKEVVFIVDIVINELTDDNGDLKELSESEEKNN